LIQDRFRSARADPCGKHAVIGTGLPASLDMARNCHADLAADLFVNSVCDLIRYGRIFLRSLDQAFFIFLLGELRVFLGDGALCYRKDGKTLAGLISLLNGLGYLLDIVGNLGDQDNVRYTCQSRMESKASHLMAHDLHDKYTTVGGCRGMDTVNGVRRDIHRALETERHIRTVDIIVNGLGKMNDVQSLFSQKIGGLLGSVSSQDHKAVEAELIICLLHGLHLVQTLLIRHAHELKGLAGGSENGSALCQDTGEIPGGEHTVFPVDQTLVSIVESIDFQLVQRVGKTLDHTAHCRVQRLAVAAACK